MVEFAVQFGQVDVVNYFRELSALDIAVKNAVVDVTEHEILGDMVYGIQNTGNLLHQSKKAFRPKQFREVDKTTKAAKEALLPVRRLIDLCRRGDEDLEEKLQRNSSRLVATARTFSQYLPLTPRVRQLGPVPRDVSDTLYLVDACYGMAVYTFNLFFSPNFKRASYLLKEDVNKFWASQFRKAKAERMVSIRKPSLVPVETKVDYFANVVLPLIKNVIAHAFNSENDIYERATQTDKPFYKSFTLLSDVDKENRQIVIQVKDHGFGIRPEIVGSVFEKGFSTKTQVGIQHGVGLWAVKEFVEMYGGRMWLESELGKGSSFCFTIPYRDKVGDVYRQ